MKVTLKGALSDLSDREVGNLLQALDACYPNKQPTLDLKDREVWYRAGQRSVIEAIVLCARNLEVPVHVPTQTTEASEAGGHPSPAPTTGSQPAVGSLAAQVRSVFSRLLRIPTK